LAWSSFIPFIVLHTSLAALGDILSSRPLAFAVLSGSSSVIEYPHFGILARPVVLIQLENARLYVLLFALSVVFFYETENHIQNLQVSK